MTALTMVLSTVVLASTYRPVDTLWVNGVNYSVAEHPGSTEYVVEGDGVYVWWVPPNDEHVPGQLATWLSGDLHLYHGMLGEQVLQVEEGHVVTETSSWPIQEQLQYGPGVCVAVPALRPPTSGSGWDRAESADGLVTVQVFYFPDDERLRGRSSRGQARSLRTELTSHLPWIAEAGATCRRDHCLFEAGDHAAAVLFGGFDVLVLVAGEGTGAGWARASIFPHWCQSQFGAYSDALPREHLLLPTLVDGQGGPILEGDLNGYRGLLRW